MNDLYKKLNEYVAERLAEFDEIPAERKALLAQMAEFIRQQRHNDSARLIFICTHNSRRSHLSQIWAQTAAWYYSQSGIECFSGGTEATAFNPRAVAAMQRAGFSIEKNDNSARPYNPDYLVSYAESAPPQECFSKTYDDKANPQQNFCAVMTCSDADEACPMVLGAAARIPIRYEDPKIADDTAQEAQRYDERCRQIAREMLYAISIL